MEMAPKIDPKIDKNETSPEIYPIFIPSAFELVLETWPTAPAPVLVGAGVIDIELEVVVLFKPPGFSVRLEEDPAPPPVVTVGVPVSPTTAVADEPAVVELAAAVKVP